MGTMTDQEWEILDDIRDRWDRLGLDSLSKDEYNILKDWLKNDDKLLTEHEGNGAIFNGKKFWIATANNLDGVIEETHTYKTAWENDFHHSFYFSQQQLDKITNDECTIFWINDGIDGEFWRNESREPWLIKKIEEQIEYLDDIDMKKRKEKEQKIPKPKPKVKKWKEWQKPFESKLNESPDFAEVKLPSGEKFSLRAENNDSVSFTTDKENKFVCVAFETGGYHNDMRDDYNSRKDEPFLAYSSESIFTGRLWFKHKFISFWHTPYEIKDNIKWAREVGIEVADPEATFKEMVLQLKQDLVDKGYIDKNENILEWYAEIRKTFGEPYEVVKLKDFKGGLFDEEEYRIHLLNAADKNKALKDMGAKPKVKKWKEWQKPFEKMITKFNLYNYDR